MYKMVKNNYIWLGIIALIVLTGSSFVLAQESSIGSTYETSCDGGICQTTVYSYEKYWFDSQSREWGEIDENFYDCSIGETTQFCTKEYYFDVVANDIGEVSSRVNANSFNMRLANFRNSQLSFNPVINGSVLTYENVALNVDLRYQYLPHKLKEEIIIKQALPNLEGDFNFTVATSGSARFAMERPYICDSLYVCEYIEYQRENENIVINVPAEFLNNPEREYPLIIDPTISLNDSNINWNGFVHVGNIDDQTLIYTRYNDPTYLTLSSSSQRGNIDWDISSIPNHSVIYNATLTLKLGAPSAPYNMSIYHMEGNNNTYPDTTGDCDGNCDFYNDMGDGTEYNTSIVPTKNAVVDFILSSSALSDIESQLDDDWFSTGLTTTQPSSASVAARDNPTPSSRPVLAVTYGVNGTDSDEAIEEGIGNSAVSGEPISSNKQIYLVNENSQHYLGTFDKSVGLGNQTWAFNYLLPGEIAIGMPSLFSVLNIWEEQSLTYNQIVNQVESFINNTVY